MKLTTTTTLMIALVAGTAYADSDGYPGKSCERGNASFCRDEPRRGTDGQRTNNKIKKLEKRIEQVNDEDQRLVDGNLSSDGDTLELYTEDMRPGDDNDISRRKVSVDVSGLATDADVAAGEARVLERARQRDERLEAQINTNSTAINANTQRIEGLEGRLSGVESLAKKNRKGVAATAALASIDFVENRPQIGLGASVWDGEVGFAIKGMAPINEDVHVSVGVFSSGGEYGAAGSVVLKF